MILHDIAMKMLLSRREEMEQEYLVFKIDIAISSMAE